MTGVSLPSVRVAALCGVCGSSEHGRPLLAPIAGGVTPHVSVSHLGDMTLLG